MEKRTGCSIFALLSIIADPVVPLVALVFAICFTSWFLSFFNMMESRGLLVTCTLGMALSRLHLLGSLKEKLDRFDAENHKFRAANKELKSSVDELGSQNAQLQNANSRLQASITGLEDVRQAMQAYADETHSDMSKLLTNLQENIAEQKRIQQQTEKIQDATQKLTTQQNRAMLMNLFFQFQNQDGSAGLNTDEFEVLLAMLPQQAGDRVRNGLLDFKSADEDGDGVISISNFRDWIRRVADVMEGEASQNNDCKANVMPVSTETKGKKLGRSERAEPFSA